ncbi:hypothetical protein [Streptomyces sp. NPDC054865]
MTAYPIARRRTPYAGRIFHSQTEARWAVFFDVLGVRWTPQPERLRLPAGRGGTVRGQTPLYCEEGYTPDFYLPDIGTWVEVKSTEKQMEEARAKVFRAAWSTGEPLLILGDMDQLYPSGPPAPGFDWAWLEISPHRWTSTAGTGPVQPGTCRLHPREVDGVQGRRVTFHRYPHDRQMTVPEKKWDFSRTPWTGTREVATGTADTGPIRAAYRAAQSSFRPSCHLAPGVEPGRMQVSTHVPRTITGSDPT